MTDGAPRPPLPVWQHFAVQWAVFTLALLVVLLLNDMPFANDAGEPLAWLTGLLVIAAGLVMGQVIHEWGHFAGTVASGAAYSLKPTLTALFFDFDYVANSKAQTLALSAGGPIGNIALISVLWLGLPPATLVSQLLLASLVGQLVFVLFLEGPVSRRMLSGEAPIDALVGHFGQGKWLFRRCYALGGAAGLVTLAVLA